MHDAIVVGGGIVGASTAYHLARAGVDALLVDRRDEGRATDAGAGILNPPTSSQSASDAWFEFAVEAVGYYPDLVARLEREGERDHGYAPRELLSVALDDETVPDFEETRKRTERRSERLDSPAPGSFTERPPEAATEAFPPLATPKRALHFENAGRVNGREFAEALLTAARSHGLDTLDASVESIRVERGAVEGVVADGDVYETDAVVVAGGAWSAQFEDDLGVAVPVEPHRGQILHLSVDADTSTWPIVGVVGHNYLVPWDDGRVVVGATREADSGFAPRRTVAGVRELVDATARVAPGLRDATVDEIRVGLRPVARDRLPVLGSVPDVEGAYLATGHGATGLMLGPYSGRLVAEMVRGREPATDTTPFRVTRFD